MRKNLSVRSSSPTFLQRLLWAGMAALLLAGVMFMGIPGGKVFAAGVDCATTDLAENWDDKASWDCLHIPAADDNVIINHELILSTDHTVNNLTINGDGAALSFTAPVTLTINGDLTVAGGALSTGSVGSVVFGGDEQTIRTNGQWIDFWNLSKTSGASLSVDPAVLDANGEKVGGIHVRHDLNLQGVTLRSLDAGSQWQIWVVDPAISSGAVSISNVSVQDSANSSNGVNPLVVPTGTNLGNNSGWVFGAVPTLNELELKIDGVNPALQFTKASFEAVIDPKGTDGTVEFFYGDGTTQVTVPECAAVAVDVDGMALCETVSLPVGNNVITAVFTSAVDENVTIDSAASVTQAVDAMTFVLQTALFEKEVVALNVSAPVNLVATINPMRNNGQVAFMSQGSVIPGCEAVNINRGRAACSTTLTKGQYAISSVYNSVTSSPVAQIVNSVSAVAVTTMSPNVVSYLSPITYNAVVTNPAPAGGTVTFRNHDLNILGCVDVPLVDNEASCTVAKPLLGSSSISVVYSGDAKTYTASSYSMPPIDQLIRAFYYLPTIKGK